jgi:hypothetical protein
VALRGNCSLVPPKTNVRKILTPKPPRSLNGSVFYSCPPPRQLTSAIPSEIELLKLTLAGAKAGLDLLDNAAGFASLLDPTNVLLALNTVFAAWNLATTFGPLEQVGSAFAANGSFSTSLGTLVVTGAQNVSFGAVVTAVPEPATWRTNTLVSTATMASHHFPAYGGTHPCKRLRLAL